MLSALHQSIQFDKKLYRSLNCATIMPIPLQPIPAAAILKQHTVKIKMKGINWLYLR